MATINLGSIKFNWQGAYAGGTSYSIDDVVSYNGSSYICKLASTGNLPTNTTYWDQMSSAGTNGTDLTSTLTTQGDLVYRDGSGLQRLGAGTAGQVLQTGGAGANPSWSTLSSDYVKLYSYEESSSTNSTTFLIDNIFNNTDYKIFTLLAHIVNVGSNGYPQWRLVNNDGTIYSSNDYFWSGTQVYYNSGGGAVNTAGAWGDTVINTNESLQTSAAHSASFEITFFGPYTSNTITRWHLSSGMYDGTFIRNVTHNGFVPNLNQFRGVQFLSHNGGIQIGNGSNFSIYGYKF